MQVLMNLCINARDAMEQGGVLSLRAEPAENRDLAEVPVRSLVQHVVLTVEDNGVGMDEETQGRIFQPFFTTKQKPGGGGLGLSTAYNIVRRHGGHLAVESAVGLGTRFSIYLPHATTRVSDRATLQTDVDAPTQVRHNLPGNSRILVVDDEPLVRRSTERLLKKIGYEVHSVQSGREAIAHYTDPANDVTLVLLDINMPEMNGEEVFRALRAFDPNVRVVLFSGYWDETRIRRILQEGALAFVRKPADAETLQAALAQAITA
jgi:CheY-like chemotaxis protein